jgi:hypothetical protein
VIGITISIGTINIQIRRPSLNSASTNMEICLKEQLAEKKSRNDTRKEFDAKGHGNQHECPPHQLLEPIQQGHNCFSLAFGRSSQIVVPNMGLAVCYSLAHDGQHKGTN